MLPVHPDIVPVQLRADGVVRVGNTRVTLDTVVFAFNQGATAEEIVQQYPALRLADVYGAIAYYLHYRDEVDAYLAQRQQQIEQIRRETEARFDPVGIRERLLARKTAQE
ncbi:MAG: DUF433 domain-containing protein [Chloroflexi bacterium]|nr:DUF433 domain-containing protein [Chloroflexota bacterium]